MDQQSNSPDDPADVPAMMTPLDEPQTKWPTVVGVIGVVMGSLGLLCGCAGFFSLPIQRWGVKMQADAGQPTAVAEAQLRVAEQFQIFLYALIVLSLVLTAWLLFSSIALLRRRRAGAKGLTNWALASLFMLFVNIAFQIMTFRATADQLNQIGEGGEIAKLYVGAVIGGCFGIVFGLSLQLFVLIWFSRAKIKSEVAQWRA